jgi:hypothetical protein
MGSIKPINFKDFDVDKLRFSPTPKDMSQGGKVINVKYGDDKLVMQMPVMRSPFKLKEYNPGKSNEDVPLAKDKNHSLQLAFNDMVNNPKVEMFYKKMKKFDSKIIDTVYDNCSKWLNKRYEKNMVEAFCNSVVKPYINKNGDESNDFPPTMKIKLPYNMTAGAYTFKCSDMDNNSIDFVDVMENLQGARVQAIVSLSVYIVGTKVIPTFNVLSVRFDVIKMKPVDFLSDSDIDKEDEDDEDEDAPVAKKQTIKDSEDEDDPEFENLVAKSSKLNVSDDEDDDDEDVPPPPTTKKTNKKVVDDDEEEHAPAKKSAKKPSTKKN